MHREVNMTRVSFSVPGRVVGKARARVIRQHGHIYAFTPDKTRNSEAVVRHFANMAMRGLPMFDGPVEVFISMWMNPPPSWSKKRLENTRWVTGKPDLDNCLKLISDALNGIVWRDDAQIARVSFVRRYTLQPEHVYIVIQGLEQGPMEKPTSIAPPDPNDAETNTPPGTAAVAG
jgi:Holliday junction resolvase RusA-like endonuclease